MLALQKALLAAGFSPGPLDGLFGPRTFEAWCSFKESVQMDSADHLHQIGPASWDALMATGENRKKRGVEHDFSSHAGTIKAICWECDDFGLNLLTQKAYVVATVKHETAGTFRPLEEYGKGRGRSYGRPDNHTGKAYYGRGFVQLTWKSNYQRYQDILGIPLVNQPELACDPNVALFILVHGFKHGTFTGRKLTDYVSPGKTDFWNARRCINGTDRAQLIAASAQQILRTL
jgi:predicted chitinase